MGGGRPGCAGPVGIGPDRVGIGPDRIGLGRIGRAGPGSGRVGSAEVWAARQLASGAGLEPVTISWMTSIGSFGVPSSKSRPFVSWAVSMNCV